MVIIDNEDGYGGIRYGYTDFMVEIAQQPPMLIESGIYLIQSQLPVQLPSNMDFSFGDLVE